MFLFCLLLFFTQEQDEKSANVWWLVYVYVQYIYVYASKTQRCVRAVVRGGVGGLFTQCRGLEYWAGWGPWFCTTSRQSPLLPLLIVWWTCDSGKKKQPQREIVCMASIINLQKNIYTFWSSGTHHQHLQICSLSRVFDQTADTKTPKMVTDMRERLWDCFCQWFYFTNNLRSHETSFCNHLEHNNTSSCLMTSNKQGGKWKNVFDILH